MRNPFFDILKFFAIMLVVYGHVSGAFGCKLGCPWLGNFIVGMNMPLFFIISGYFAAKTIEGSDWVKLGKHLLGYFWPTAVVSCGFAVLAVLFHVSGSEKGLIGYAGRWFLFSPWFLWCLAICFLLTFLCMRLKHPVLRGGAFLLLTIALPCLKGVWYMGNVRAMLPHFLFGVFVLRKWECWKWWYIGLPCLLVYLLGVVFQGDIHGNGLSFYGQDTTWFAFMKDPVSVIQYGMRITNGIIGGVGIMWILQFVMDRFDTIKRLAPFGTTTLGVYILHQWILARIAAAKCYSGSVVVVLFWSGIIFLFCHYLTWWTKKIRILRRWMWGVFDA